MAFDPQAYRDLYPFENHWLTVNGQRMHFVDEGQGETLVMVHGNPTWSFYYRNLIQALRDRYRCIAVDHVGCGLSDKPGDDEYEYTLRRRIDDLEAFLDQSGLHENVTLVGHDWGGMIGTACALRKPQRFRRLVLFNTAAFGLPPAKHLPVRLWLIRNLRLFAPLAVRGLNMFAWAATWMAVAGHMPSRVRAAYLAPYDSWANRIATLRFVQDIPLHPKDPSYDTVQWVDQNLHRLADRPTLIGWGMKDFVFDEHFLNEWRRRMPDARVHTFPDAGHYVLEDAGKQIAKIVQDFLQQHPVDEIEKSKQQATDV
jgi:haloalkane dehalogenase